MQRCLISLVSSQPLPNLLAALEPSLGIGVVHLLVSGEMEVAGTASALAQAIEGAGKRVQVHMVSDAFQPEATRSLVGAILGDHPEAFLVNLTGGTKPMVLGAYRASVERGVASLLYLDPDAGQFRWLDSDRPPLPAHADIGAAVILRAHGFESRPPAAPSRAAVQLSESLHQQLSGQALGIWNRLFSAIERKCGDARAWRARRLTFQSLVQDPMDPIVRPLREAAAFGFCEVGDDWILVDRAEDNQLLCGGWFEIVVWQALKGMAGRLGLDEVLLNLHLRGPDEAANEIDCLARRGSRLLVFEVKTAEMAGPYGIGRPQEVLYRLLSLRQVGGLTGRGCLVSLAPVSERPGKRFAGAGIGLVQGAEASPDALAPHLERWIASG